MGTRLSNLAAFLLFTSGNAFSESNAFQTTQGSTVSVIDLKTSTKTAAIGFSGSIDRLLPGTGGSALYLATFNGYLGEASTTSKLLTGLFSDPLLTQVGPMVLSPDGATLYVSSQSLILVFDVKTRALAAQIPNPAVQLFPAALAISKDGTKLYALNIFTPGGHGLALGQLNVMDIHSGTVTGSLSGLFGGGFVLSPDGVHAYATATTTNFQPSSVLFIDLNAMKFTARVNVPATELGVSPDGATLYAFGSVLTEIATTTRQITAEVTLPGQGSPGPFALDPRNPVAYYAFTVANGVGAVAAIDLTKRTVTFIVNLSGTPDTLALSTDGQTLYAGLVTPDLEVALQTSGRRVSRAIEVPGLPLCAAASPDGSIVYVGYAGSPNVDGGVAVVDTSSLQTSFLYQLPNNPASAPVALAVPPDGATQFISTTDGSGNGEILAIDLRTSGYGIQGTLPVSGVAQMVASPDDRFIYAVADSNTAVPTVLKIDRTNLTIVATASLNVSGGVVSAVAIWNAGAVLYVGVISNTTSSIQLVNTSDLSPLGAFLQCGVYIAMSPDGSTLYAACPNSSGTSGAIYALNPSSGAIMKTYTEPFGVNGLAVTPDGKTLWVPGYTLLNLPGIMTTDVASGANSFIPTLSAGSVVFAK